MNGADAAAEPLVSAIIVVRNGARFLDEAIRSVLTQTWPRRELLIVDDGSTDASPTIAASYVEAHPGTIRLLRHEGGRGRGISASRNLGLAEARGEFVGFLDADDVWLPDKLDVQLALMRKHPTAAVVCGPSLLWYGWTGLPDDDERDTLRPITEPADVLYDPPELLRRLLADRALTPATCSALLRRSAFERVGGFEAQFRGMYEDQAFFAKVYLELPVFVTSTCTDRYRQHEDSVSMRALEAGSWSLHRPSRSLVRFHLWLARMLVRRRVRDRVVWQHMLRKLWETGRYYAIIGWRRTPRAGTSGDTNPRSTPVA